MGTWGYKIFQNDDAADIRDTYQEKIIVGISDKEAEQAIIQEFSLGESSAGWVPFAITEWKLGRLSENVKSHALLAIDAELECLTECWKPNQAEKRREELLQAKHQICSKVPKPKNMKLPKWAFSCPWQIGNVLQYKIKDISEENSLYNSYVLLSVAGISHTPEGKIPCESVALQLYDWIGIKAPSSIKDELLLCPPDLIDFVMPSGKRKRTHTIQPSSHMIRFHEISVVSKEPFISYHFSPAEASSPLNSSFEMLIENTFRSRGNSKHL